MFEFLKRLQHRPVALDPERQKIHELLATPDSLLAHLQWGRAGEGDHALQEKLVRWAGKVIRSHGYGTVTVTTGYLAPNVIVETAGGPVVVLVLIASFAWRNAFIPSSRYVDVVNAVERLRRLPGRPERFILLTSYRLDVPMQEVLGNQWQLHACHLDLDGSAEEARLRLAHAVGRELIALCQALPPVSEPEAQLMQAITVVRPGFSGLHERLQRSLIAELLRAVDGELTTVRGSDSDAEEG